MPRPESFISIDIEASGPSPSTGSMIALGACLVTDPRVGLYREIQPIAGLPWDPAAERIHELTESHLAMHGMAPQQAMSDLDEWLRSVAPGRQPVFVGFNAAFDWMFVADYLHRFLGRNPFGISALDLKGVYMGRQALARWDATRYREVMRTHPTRQQVTHHALDDARAQAELAQLLLAPGPSGLP